MNLCILTSGGEATALEGLSTIARLVQLANGRILVMAGGGIRAGNAHSIIAVKGTGPVEAGDDGVVKYSSAHIDGVESELIVRSGHSTQATPQTIEEVRRILYEHAGIH